MYLYKISTKIYTYLPISTRVSIYLHISTCDGGRMLRLAVLALLLAASLGPATATRLGPDRQRGAESL